MSINIASNFHLFAQLPLDERTVVADVTARDAIPAGERFDGMVVYVTTGSATYQLQGGITNLDWVVFGGSAAYVFSNGITEAAGAVKLGGALTANTTINTTDFTLIFQDDNVSPGTPGSYSSLTPFQILCPNFSQVGDKVRVLLGQSAAVGQAGAFGFYRDSGNSDNNHIYMGVFDGNDEDIGLDIYRRTSLGYGPQVTINANPKGDAEFTLPGPAGKIYLRGLWLTPGEMAGMTTTVVGDVAGASGLYVKNDGVNNELFYRYANDGAEVQLTGAGAGVYTFSNGLTEAALAVKLGGALTGATAITATAANTLSVIATTASAEGIFRLYDASLTAGNNITAYVGRDLSSNEGFMFGYHYDATDPFAFLIAAGGSFANEEGLYYNIADKMLGINVFDPDANLAVYAISGETVIKGSGATGSNYSGEFHGAADKVLIGSATVDGSYSVVAQTYHAGISTNEYAGVIGFAGYQTGVTVHQRVGARIAAIAAADWTTDHANWAPTHLIFCTQDETVNDTLNTIRMSVSSDGNVSIADNLLGPVEKLRVQDLTARTSDLVKFAMGGIAVPVTTNDTAALWLESYVAQTGCRNIRSELYSGGLGVFDEITGIYSSVSTNVIDDASSLASVFYGVLSDAAGSSGKFGVYVSGGGATSGGFNYDFTAVDNLGIKPFKSTAGSGYGTYIQGGDAIAIGDWNGGYVYINGGIENGTGDVGNVLVANTRGSCAIGSGIPLSKLHLFGGMAANRTATAIDYSVLNTDFFIGITNTDALRTITLPANVTYEDKFFFFKDESYNCSLHGILLVGVGGAKVNDSVLGFLFPTDGYAAGVYCDGTDWHAF